MLEKWLYRENPIVPASMAGWCKQVSSKQNLSLSFIFAGIFYFPDMYCCQILLCGDYGDILELWRFSETKYGYKMVLIPWPPVRHCKIKSKTYGHILKIKFTMTCLVIVTVKNSKNKLQIFNESTVAMAMKQLICNSPTTSVQDKKASDDWLVT